MHIEFEHMIYVLIVQDAMGSNLKQPSCSRCIRSTPPSTLLNKTLQTKYSLPAATSWICSQIGLPLLSRPPITTLNATLKVSTAITMQFNLQVIIVFSHHTITVFHYNQQGN